MLLALALVLTDTNWDCSASTHLLWERKLELSGFPTDFKLSGISGWEYGDTSNLNTALFRQSPLGTWLARNTAAFQHQLPLDLVADICSLPTSAGPDADPLADTTYPQSSPIVVPPVPKPIADNPCASTRKRHEARCPTTVEKRPRRQRANNTFACVFHIYRPGFFCIQYGPTGTNRYKACAGPGFSQVRRMSYAYPHILHDTLKLPSRNT